MWSAIVVVVHWVCLCSVSDCRVNRFGPDCLESCECENGGQCDRRNGRCSCLHSWIGLNCQEGAVMTNRLFWLTRLPDVLTVTFAHHYVHMDSSWQTLSRSRSDVLAESVKKRVNNKFKCWLFTHWQNCRRCTLFGRDFFLIEFEWLTALWLCFLRWTPTPRLREQQRRLPTQLIIAPPSSWKTPTTGADQLFLLLTGLKGRTAGDRKFGQTVVHGNRLWGELMDISWLIHFSFFKCQSVLWTVVGTLWFFLQSSG